MLLIADYMIPEIGITIVPRTAMREDRSDGDQHRAWDRLADHIRKWSLDPSQLEDDGIPAPTQETLALAHRVATLWQAGGSRAFDRVTPTGDGGIAFTAEQDDELATLEIDPSGDLELLHLRAGRVSVRLKIFLLSNQDG
jgi:hypothetical protein